MEYQDNTDYKNRAGRYREQPAGYRAFVPNILPPGPPVRLEGKLRVILSEAERALARLDGAIQTLPDADVFTQMFMRKEAILSNQIEGNRSSLSDSLANDANVSVPDQLDLYDVTNYVEALEYGLENLREKPLYTQLIKDIHKCLSRESRDEPGEFRDVQTWIGRPGVTIDDAYFVPPPPEEVRIALEALEKFTSDSDELPPLVRVGLAHAQFEMILPFISGNGRVSRILTILLLIQQGVLNAPVLYFSLFFRRYRGEYNWHLQAIREEGKWEDWLTFFLRGVEEASSEAFKTIRQILALREMDRHRISADMGRAAADGNLVLEYLFEKPFIKVDEVINITKTGYAAANNLVKRLTNIGILRETSKVKRNRVFHYYSYLQILGEGTDVLQENREEAQS